MDADTTHIRTYQPDKDRLQALFPDRQMPDRIKHLVEFYQANSPDHKPILKEGDDGRHEVGCLVCGQSAESLANLEAKECVES